MRATVHSHVPESVRTAALGWLPDSEFAVSLLDEGVASCEVATTAGTVAVAVVVEGRRSLSGAPVIVACAGAPRSAAVSSDSPGTAAGRDVAQELARTLVPRVQAAGSVEVVGPAGLARPVAQAVAASAGGRTEIVMEQRLLIASEALPPADVEGVARPATAGDRPLLGTWFDEFTVEALGGEPLGVERWVERLGEVAWDQWLWEVDGAPVSLVNARTTTPRSARIGPVYTPPRRRGHGYAAALTAHVAQVLLGRADERVTLFTDQANPTSNALYVRVGFTDVGAHGSWLVSVADDGLGAAEGVESEVRSPTRRPGVGVERHRPGQ